MNSAEDEFDEDDDDNAETHTENAENTQTEQIKGHNKGHVNRDSASPPSEIPDDADSDTIEVIQADWVQEMVLSGSIDRPRLLQNLSRLHTFVYLGEKLSGTHLHAHGSFS